MYWSPNSTLIKWCWQVRAESGDCQLPEEAPSCSATIQWVPLYKDYKASSIHQQSGSRPGVIPKPETRTHDGPGSTRTYSGFRVQGAGCRVQGSGSEFRVPVQGLQGLVNPPAEREPPWGIPDIITST